jgi:hypothetical protein
MKNRISKTHSAWRLMVPPLVDSSLGVAAGEIQPRISSGGEGE